MTQAKSLSVRLSKEDANELAALLKRYKSIADGIGDRGQSELAARLSLIFTKATKA